VIKTLEKDLWSLVWGRPEVDPNDLFEAIVVEAPKYELDYRTRLLIRDSIDALRDYWGSERLNQMLIERGIDEDIEDIVGEEFERVGFHGLRERLMKKTDPKDVEAFFHELGAHIHRSTKLEVGGSIALILPGHLSRTTEDIDVVDEVPEELRAQHQLLADLQKRFGLLLTHFQRHYLPMGWENRLHYFNSYGSLRVYLLDVYDVSLSKLFSRRDKDYDDLRILRPQLEKEVFAQRMRDTTASMLASEPLRKVGEHNWYRLYGESLPT
jgi:hypothetical protein